MLAPERLNDGKAEWAGESKPGRKEAVESRRERTGPAHPNFAGPKDNGDSTVDKDFKGTVFFNMKIVS